MSLSVLQRAKQAFFVQHTPTASRCAPYSQQLMQELHNLLEAKLSQLALDLDCTRNQISVHVCVCVWACACMSVRAGVCVCLSEYTGRWLHMNSKCHSSSFPHSPFLSICGWKGCACRCSL